MIRAAGVTIAISAVLLSGCSGSSPGSRAHQAPGPSQTPQLLWAAPSDPMTRASQAGLVPEKQETLVHHVHAHLDVFVDGRPVVVPAGIGINISDPAVHTGGAGLAITYGGISTPCLAACISPLHTHDATGILHTESASATPNTLGQFFTEWGVRLTADCLETRCGRLAVFIDGKRYHGDPGAIQLLDRREIVVASGSLPAVVPSAGDFSNA